MTEKKMSRRMTHKELSRWLREKPTRECTHKTNLSHVVYTHYSYLEIEASEKLDDGILIREDDGEWREPLVEIEDEIKMKKENAELKSKNCWKTCEYVEPKAQWISQHIQDVAQLSKAKEIIKKLVHEFYYLCELYNFATDYECLAEADQFIREVRSE